MRSGHDVAALLEQNSNYQRELDEQRRLTELLRNEAHTGHMACMQET